MTEDAKGLEDTLAVPGRPETVLASTLDRPQSIGPYRILQLIGEGGMGEVWLAEQVEPLRRRVAIKVIKLGMDTKHVVARFESERQALALMDHQAIARVFDAGSTAEGRPYFVMEYVPGVPLTEHCDTHKLPTAARLALFMQVCDGVQHAHQKAVIHRDLKPSNILVALVDGKPQPKIIDFGIAKAVGARLTEKTLFTEIGSVIGTPEYMSPEQADLTSQDVDTRTDVYSLGVILYQLLTGELPFSSGQLRSSSYEELRRKLREVEPPAPSTKVSTLGAVSTETAANRKTDVVSLRRALKGDLDAITLKALEKERARRYGSPAELAADVQRHLRNEPVLASPPSWAYRARKYVRRHRMGVALAATLLALLASFSVAMAVQAQRVARERDRANREAASAKRVADFMTRMFRVSSPNEARGSSVTAREILDKASMDVDSLSSDPELQARLQYTMGIVYKNLGLMKQGEGLLKAARETQGRLLGAEHLETLATTFQLGETKFLQGLFADAETLLRQALAGQRRLLGPENPATLRTMGVLANLLSRTGRLADAVSMMQQTVPLMRKTLGPEAPQTLASTSQLAAMLGDVGKLPEAEALFRQVLEAQTRVLGPDHPDTANTLGDLASVLEERGELAEAEKLQRQSLEVSQRVLGPDNINTLVSLANLANLLAKQGRLQDAEALAREANERRRRALGPEHPDTISGLVTLGTILASEGRLPDAEGLHRQALEIDARVLGADHPSTALVKLALAGDLALGGRRAEAVALLQDALAHGLSEEALAGLGDEKNLQALHGMPAFDALLAKAKPAEAK